MRGLKYYFCKCFHYNRSRTSHEVRGLKSIVLNNQEMLSLSHLTRGAWIEISSFALLLVYSNVAPHTRCVDWNAEKMEEIREKLRRTSHEVRGLKCSRPWIIINVFRSHLTRGAWIEMTLSLMKQSGNDVAPHTRCVDWNTEITKNNYHNIESHLTRGAWIEMVFACMRLSPTRSRTSHEVRGLKYLISRINHLSTFVAPHTRCVDWNIIIRKHLHLPFLSHLTRGAWIEILFL